MATLNATQVYAVARQAGASHQEAVTLTAIARGESGWNTNSHNPNAGTGDNSYGLWQINMLGNMGPSRRKQFGISSNDELFDPLTNARAAIAILRGQGWKAWTIYRNGSYKKWMPEAEQAGRTVGDNWNRVSVPRGRDAKADTGSTPGGGVGEVLGGNPMETYGAGGGGAGAPKRDTLPPNATPEQVDKYMRENYPSFAGFLDVPEIRGVLVEAAQADAAGTPWSSEKLNGKIQATSWWKQNGENARRVFALERLDPAQYQRELAAKTAEMQPLLQSIGYVGDPSPFISEALKYGWTDTEIVARLAVGLQNQSSNQGLTVGSSVDVSAEGLAKIARNEYLLPLTEQDTERWAIDIFAGHKTEEEFRDYLNRLSTGRFGDLIDQGITPGEYFAPIRNVIAETLELQPGDIDLLNTQWSEVLEAPDGKGGYYPMSISQAQRWARARPEYRTTQGARDQSAALGEVLANTFGKVAS